MPKPAATSLDHHVVILGGGFAGLNVAKGLRRAPVRVTLIDRENFHLFQPLLYQVATGSLSPANIAAPLRNVVGRYRNTHVLMGEVQSMDPQSQTVHLSDGKVTYDTLVVATGARHHYFGNDHYEQLAPGLKSITDATRIRARILSAFEAAERAATIDEVERLLTFVIVGAGPTGLELAGAIADLARRTLPREYRNINTAQARVLLVEGQDQILPSYPSALSQKALDQLQRIGVTISKGTLVSEINGDDVLLRRSSASAATEERVAIGNVFWAAGIQASRLGKSLAQATGAETDVAGRIVVGPDCSLAGFPNILVLGDLASYSNGHSKPLPATAAVAAQQGKHTARQIRRRQRGKPLQPFRYRDLGQMATIGKFAAVCDLGPLKLSGWLAWQVWLFLHLMLLIGFQNRLLVLTQWAISYFTNGRSARLITERQVSETHKDLTDG